MNIYEIEKILHLIEEKISQKKLFCMAFLDLDKSKEETQNFNDLISNFSDVLNKSKTKEYYYLGRDEFILFLDGKTDTAFQSLIEFKLLWEQERVFNVSFSVGLVCTPTHGNTAEDLLRRAEEGLYRAKLEGRNRICQPDNESLVLKSNYYYKYQLHRLKSLSKKQQKKESEILRLALDEFFRRYDDL